MKSLVIYESFYGNTEAVAKAIAEELKVAGEVKISKISLVAGDLSGADLLVLGCPIIKWVPSEGMGAFRPACRAGSTYTAGRVRWTGRNWSTRRRGRESW